jgi:hypothetical protein
MNAVERIANSYTTERETSRQNLAVAQGQLADYQARIGQPFGHEAYLNELTSLRDQLRTALSATPAEGSPGTVELAEKIKALKAANAVEAAPQRTATRIASAEEPVTTRIRRKAEALPAPDHAIESNAAASPANRPMPDESTAPAVENLPRPDWSIRPETSYAEQREARGR